MRLLGRLGFQVERSSGSRQILKAPTGGSVVVPHHKEIALGTLKSIAEQAENALKIKREDE